MRVIGSSDDRAKWLEARRSGLGASDIAAVVGLSPWATPWSVYVDKIGAVPLDDAGAEHMRWGQLLENVILDWWQATTGHHAWSRGWVVAHDEHEWMTATLDALGFAEVADIDDDTPKDPLAVIEVKTTGDWSWDVIPIQYRAQAQWQMAVTGLDRVIFAVLHNGKKFEAYDLEADYDDQQALIDAGERFWTDHVLAQVPPPVDAADNRRLADVWPFGDPDSQVEVDRDLVVELMAVKAEQKLMQERRDWIEARIKEALGEAAFGVDADGEQVVSWKTQSANRFDTSRLKAERPDVYAEFMPTDKTSRVLRTHIKQEKE